MPTFQVRNRTTKIVLGEVTVVDPADVIDELKNATGSSIDEIAASLGSTIDEARAALDIVEVRPPSLRPSKEKGVSRSLPPRRLYG